MRSDVELERLPSALLAAGGLCDLAAAREHIDHDSAAAPRGAR